MTKEKKTILPRNAVKFTSNQQGNPSGYYIYLHRKATDMSIFYVGKGKNDRWRCTARTNKHWQNVALKHGVFVEILMYDLQEWYAYEKEVELIAYYGRKDLKEGELVNHDNGGYGGPESETEVYSFANFDTGATFEGTKNQFKDKIGFHPYRLVKVPNHRRNGWYVVGNVSKEKIEKYTSEFSRCSDDLYNFVNFKTGQELTTTLSKFKKETNVNPTHIISGRKNSNHGWTTKEIIEKVGMYKVQNPFHDRYSNDPIYELYNFKLDIVFTGTRCEFSKQYDVQIATLFRKTKGSNYAKGWCLLKDKEYLLMTHPLLVTYSFIHKNGEVFTGTRGNFRDKYNIEPESLFQTRRAKTCIGWSLL